MVLLGKLHERQFASADEEYDRETGREKAILHYQRAHEAGEIDGTVSLGTMIEDQHPEKALKLYWIGDKVGHAFAKYRLANMYANGRVVDKNEKEALRLYRDAAGLGCYDAAIALSNFHRVTPPFIDLRNANRLNKFGMSQFKPFSQERT
jgi:TPR repeat protein